MMVYKFRDGSDGKFAFIMAKDQDEATKTLQNLTSIPFSFIEAKSVEELNRPMVLYNHILPF